MGNYLADIEGPKEAEERHNKLKRLIQLRGDLENIPLSNFTVGDLKPIRSVLSRGIYNEPSEKDFKRLEQKVQEFKQKSALVAKS